MRQKVWYNFNNERSELVNNEPNKPAEELKETELRGVVRGKKFDVKAGTVECVPVT